MTLTQSGQYYGKQKDHFFSNTKRPRFVEDKPLYTTSEKTRRVDESSYESTPKSRYVRTTSKPKYNASPSYGNYDSFYTTSTQAYLLPTKTPYYVPTKRTLDQTEFYYDDYENENNALEVTESSNNDNLNFGDWGRKIENKRRSTLKPKTRKQKPTQKIATTLKPKIIPTSP